MLGKKDRQERLVMIGGLRSLLPDDHILVKVQRVLDLSWLRAEVQDAYCLDNGKPSIDPEAALRLMLAGFLLGIVHDRELLREAQVNLAIRWFAGYALDETLPHASNLTRLRQRWGQDRFRRIFERTVHDCVAAGLVKGQTLHVDGTLIRANVSWESLTTEHVRRVWDANEEAEESDHEQDPPPTAAGATQPDKAKKRSRTDPDATMTTARRDQRLEPSYKEHVAVDDEAGVVVAVQLTTGEVNEGRQLPALLVEAEANTGRAPETVTADGGYAHPANYELLEARKIEAVIPPSLTKGRAVRWPLARFKYDAKHHVVRCPGGKMLTRRTRVKNGWVYRASRATCQGCPLFSQCVPATAKARMVLIVDGYEALLRVRRRWRRRGAKERHLYGRHRWRVEGAHAEAKQRHGMRRAVRWGLANVAIQVYLTAAVMNLKRLAALPYHLTTCFWRSIREKSFTERLWSWLERIGLSLRPYAAPLTIGD